MKDPKSTVRYLGFQALVGGGRRFQFSFARPDASLQLICVDAPNALFSGPDHMAIQECAGICYETLKCVVGTSQKPVPAIIELTSADIAEHRKVAKTRRANP